ncbi:hypothetical protein WN55_06250, partial [Dufourea novaeangliae]
KIHFLYYYLDIFSKNLGTVNGKHGERLHQNIVCMEKLYQSKWSSNMLADTAGPSNGVFLKKNIPEN